MDRTYVEPELQGRELFKVYLPLYLVSTGSFALLLWSFLSIDEPGFQPAAVIGTAVFYLVLILVSQLLSFFLHRFVVTSTRFRGERLGFTGKPGRFLALNVKWLLLTIITFGVWSFWYAQRMWSYLVSHTEYNGERFSFEGKGGRLLVIVLLVYMLPVFACGLIAGLLQAFWDAGYTAVIILIPIFLFIIPVYTHLATRWVIDIRFRGFHVRYSAPFWRSVGLFFLQFALAFVTVLIYYPAAILKMDSWVLRHTRARKNSTPGFYLGFDGNIGRGFILIWAQWLLTGITLGVYYPWAVSRVLNWFLTHVYLQQDETPD